MTTLTVSHFYSRGRQVRCSRRVIVFRPVFSEQQCRHVRRTGACGGLPLRTPKPPRLPPTHFGTRRITMAAVRKRYDHPSNFDISVKTVSKRPERRRPIFRFVSARRQSRLRQKKRRKLTYSSSTSGQNRRPASSEWRSKRCDVFVYTALLRSAPRLMTHGSPSSQAGHGAQNEPEPVEFQARTRP